MSEQLQVVILSGATEVQRAVFGFASALAAASSGARVHVVLSMHGAHWAAETTGDELSVPEFASIGELIERIQEIGGVVEACSTCVDNYCPSPRGPDGLKQLRAGIVRIGLGLVAIRMSDMPTVTC